MSHTTGTATNYADLLDKIDAYLTATGHAWGKSFTGAGNGDLVNYLGGASSVAETITITLTSPTAFSVSGSVSGSMGTGTVGAEFSNAKVRFTVTAGGTAYQAGDVWTISTSPAWTRIREEGCAGADKRSGSLLNIENLFDSDEFSRATASSATGYVDFEMHRATEIREVVLQNYSTATKPTAFRVQYKDTAGGSWSTAQSWSGQTWTFDREAKTLSVPAVGSHKFWRFEITASSAAAIELSSLQLRAKAGDSYNTGFQAQVAWTAPGLGGSSSIGIGAITYGSSAADAFSLGFAAFRSHNAARAVDAQLGGSTSRWLALVNSSIDYWLVVNGQRLILVTKAGGLYQTAYVGFGNPYEPPSVHAFPCVVGASSALASRRYDAQVAEYRHPMDPGDGLAAFYPNATWVNHSNRYNGGGNSPDFSFQSAGGKVWPSALRIDNDARPTFIRENVDGSRPLIPGVLMSPSSPSHVFGEFDGYFWTTGFGTVAEATIREAGFDHLVVPNIYRTGVNHYAAVRLD